jgi:hypothetical protein
VVPLLCRPGERPDPLQEHVTITAGTAMQVTPRRYRLVRTVRRSHRGVLALTAISERGRRDQAYGSIECMSRVLHQDLTKMAPTGPSPIAAS